VKIATDVEGLRAKRFLEESKKSEERASFRMSSGERIYQAAEDPAGLAISEKMKSYIASQTQAKRNANDGLSLVQVTEGALNVVQSLAIRMRELAMQAATDTVGASERSVVNREYQLIKDEVSRVTQSTRFNGKLVLRGDDSTYDLHIGFRNNPDADKIVYKMKDVLSTLEEFGVDTTYVSTKEGARSALGLIDSMQTKIGKSRSSLGSMASRLTTAMTHLDIENENLNAGKSRIRDADFAKETALQVSANLKTSAGAEVLKSSNASKERVSKLVDNL
jgi:flagellin